LFRVHEREYGSLILAVVGTDLFIRCEHNYQMFTTTASDREYDIIPGKNEKQQNTHCATMCILLFFNLWELWLPFLPAKLEYKQ
jgi:hypothetical protein